MTRSLPWLLCLVGCDMFATGELPSPEFIDTEATCAAGEMTFIALIRSELDVSNLVLERTDIDHAELDPIFPLVTTETWGGEVTEWTAPLAHDCEASIAVEWTATTLAETESTAESAWPDVDLVDGPVEPPFGTSAGGSVVTITGTDMHEVDRVWFDGELATIIENTDTMVAVETPPHADGLVDVRIAAGVTELDLPESFTYWPDRGGQVTGTAHLVTHLYSTNWFTIGSAYVDAEDFTYGNFAQHEVIFHEGLDPSETMGTLLYPPVGTCDDPSEYYWTMHSVGSYVKLVEDNLGELPMLPTGGEQSYYYYVQESLDIPGWTGVTFDLELPTETERYPAMLVEDLMPVPEDPRRRSWDFENLNTATRYDDLTLTWSPGLADKVSYTLYPVYHDSWGLQVLGTMSCMADGTTGLIDIAWDDIMAGIDPEVPTGIIANIGMLYQQDSVMPHDNGIFQSTAILNYWVYYVFP